MNPLWLLTTKKLAAHTPLTHSYILQGNAMDFQSVKLHIFFMDCPFSHRRCCFVSHAYSCFLYNRAANQSKTQIGCNKRITISVKRKGRHAKWWSSQFKYMNYTTFLRTFRQKVLWNFFGAVVVVVEQDKWLCVPLMEQIKHRHAQYNCIYFKGKWQCHKNSS